MAYHIMRQRTFDEYLAERQREEMREVADDLLEMRTLEPDDGDGLTDDELREICSAGRAGMLDCVDPEADTLRDAALIAAIEGE